MEVKREYHRNGELRSEFQVNESGQLHGYRREYYPNGQLRNEVDFKNSKQCPGEVISFHENGQKAREVYVDEKTRYQGKFSEWFDNGSIKRTGNYKNDEFDGDFKEFFKNGALKAELKYKNGEFDGDFKEFFENGALKAELKYKKGKIIARTDYLDNGLKLNEVKVKSNSEMKNMLNDCLAISKGKISIDNFKLEFNYKRGRRMHCLVGDYEGFKFFCRPVVELKQDEIYDPGNGIGDYIKDLSNGQSLSGIEEVNSFLDKLGDCEICDLFWPQYYEENFYMMDSGLISEISEGCRMQEDTPSEILDKFLEDEDFFYDDVRNFIEYGEELKHYAIYKGIGLFNKPWSVVDSVEFTIKSSNIALKIKWIYNKKVSNKLSKHNWTSNFKLINTFNLCDSIASILYGFLLEKASIMQIMISYVAWKNSISLLLKDEKNNDFNNYLAEACHYLIFKSNGFGDHEDDIIESRINAIKDINFDEELEINLKLNLYLCLYTNAALKFIDENKDYGSVSGDKIRDLKSLNNKLLNSLNKADELFKVLS